MSESALVASLLLATAVISSAVGIAGASRSLAVMALSDGVRVLPEAFRRSAAA